jgi:hypothetical protein
MGVVKWKETQESSIDTGTRVWYVESKGGLDPTFVSKFLKGGRWKTCEKGEQDCLGQQAFESLRKKNSEAKILLVQSFKELRGDSTGSSNSKPF